MISTKGRYALRVMLDLAEHDPEEYVPLEEIALRQGISKKYLETILKNLVQKDMLQGVRGRGGGYRLTREPKDYSVGEILELTEDTLAVVACLKEDAEFCKRRSYCKTFPMWEKLNKMTHDFYFGITLEDLM